MIGKCYKAKYGGQAVIMARGEAIKNLAEFLVISFDEYRVRISSDLINVLYLSEYYQEITLDDFKKAFKDFIQAADVIYKDAIREIEGEA
jgi:hypothetical protein